MISPTTVANIPASVRTRFMPKGLFELGEVNIVYGKHSSGKTTLMTAIANDIANRKCGGRSIDTLLAYNVMYFASEGLHHVVDKFRKIQKDSKVLISGGYLDIGSNDSVSHLAEICKQENIKFVVIDTLTASLSEGSRNDDSKVNKIYHQLKTKLCNQGVTVVLVMHTLKGSDDLSGSYQWQTDVPVVWMVKDGVLKCKKYRNGEKPKDINWSNHVSEDIQTAEVDWSGAQRKFTPSAIQASILENWESDKPIIDIKWSVYKSLGNTQKSLPDAFHVNFDRNCKKLINVGQLEAQQYETAKTLTKTN